MKRFTFQSEHIEYMKSAYKTMSLLELTKAFNEKFNVKKTFSQIKAATKNHKITCGRKQGELTKGKFRSYTNEQAEFLKIGYQTLSLSDLTTSFNVKFSIEKTEKQIRSFLRNHKIKSGRTGHFNPGDKSWNAGTKGLMKPNSGSFKKGDRPVNWRPVGSERINVDGYIEIKISEPRTWELKQRVVWSEHKGVIPPGHNVRFNDGDRLNCSIENLFLVNDSENRYLTHLGFSQAQPEIKPTVILMAKIQSKTNQLTKR